jgi:deoxyribodipyrimidine photo-lyase
MTLPFELNKTPDVFSSFRKKIEKYGSFQKPINLPNIPTFNEPYKLAGGEQQAIHRLNYYFFEKKLLSTYKETRNGMLGTDFSSRFSPWLSNGNISARTIHYFVKDYENKLGANSSTYWLIFELLWRDFFQFQLRKHGSLFF